MRGKGLVDEFDEKLVDDILDLTRLRGYAISFGYTLDEDFQRKLSTPEGARTAFEGLWDSTIHAFDAYRRDQEPHTLASAIQLPIFGRDGQVLLELLIGSFDAKTDPERFRWIVETGADYARRITDAIGGRQPADYMIRWP